MAVCMFMYVPDSYSLSYCYVCFSLFLVAFIVLYKEKVRKNIVCFEFIFSLAFFFTNYVYPLFYYPINPYFSLFLLDFPEGYINDGCVLATIGYLAFCLGDLRYKVTSQYVNKVGAIHEFKISPLYIPIANVIIVLLIISLFEILLSGIYDGNWGEGSLYKVLADLFIYYLIFAFFTRENSITVALSKERVFWILVLCYVIEITMIGNRGLLIRICLLTLFLYTHLYKNIKAKYLIVVMLGGMFLLYYVGSVRGGGSYEGFSDKKIPIILQIGQDLTINNRSLYVLMDYYEKYGPSFGQTWLMNLLSIVPFGQSMFLKITGASLAEINSASLVTELHFRDSDAKLIGLGTNLIGDIYLSFGLLGVILFMFLLGKFLSYSYARGIKGDMLYLFIYAMLLMDCIILTRSTYLTSIRPLAWGIALYYFAKRRKNISIH